MKEVFSVDRSTLPLWLALRLVHLSLFSLCIITFCYTSSTTTPLILSDKKVLRAEILVPQIPHTFLMYSSILSERSMV